MNFPILRFSEFNQPWEEKTLGEVCKIQNGYAFKSEKFITEGIPVLRISNISANERYLDFDNLVFYEKIKNDTNFIVSRNDLIIAMSGATTGKASLSNLDFAYLNQRVGLFKKNSDLLHYPFLVQFVFSQSFKYQLDGILVAGAQPNVSGSDIEKMQIQLPALAEQNKIASFLSAADTRLQLLKQKQQLLQQYKKGTMQRIFSQELRFKDENGQDFADWEEKTLGEVCKQVKRTAKNDISNLDVLTISAEHGLISQKERFSQVIAGNSLSKYTLLKKGEMSYNRGASKRFQFGCFYTLQKLETALVPNVYISFAFNENANSLFYEFLFSTGYANRQLRQFVSSSVRLDGLLNIGREDFFTITVPFPSLAEQQKIAGFLSGIDAQIRMVSEQVAAAEAWKKALLQQMLL